MAFDPKKCGTHLGKDQHRHRGEPVCEPCRLAWNAACNERRAKDRRRRGIRERLVGSCSQCGKDLIGATLAEPVCRKCRGKRPGETIRISPAGRRAIYERDEWTCQICLDPVDPTTPTNTTWDATLDHIVPRSRGGDDDPSNLRLAHRWCNAARSNLSHYTDDDFRVA